LLKVVLRIQRIFSLVKLELEKELQSFRKKDEEMRHEYTKSQEPNLKKLKAELTAMYPDGIPQHINEVIDTAFSSMESRDFANFLAKLVENKQSTETKFSQLEKAHEDTLSKYDELRKYRESQGYGKGLDDIFDDSNITDDSMDTRSTGRHTGSDAGFKMGGGEMTHNKDVSVNASRDPSDVARKNLLDLLSKTPSSGKNPTRRFRGTDLTTGKRINKRSEPY